MKAIEKDDRYAEAYGLCAGTYVVLEAYRGMLVSPEERAEALQFADRAATLGTDDALPLARAAQALVWVGDGRASRCAEPEPLDRLVGPGMDQ